MSDNDPRTLANGDLEAEVATLSAQLDVAEHRLLALIGELDRRQRHRDHGLPTLAAWLSWRVGLGPVAAREKVRVAKALAELPHISTAFSRAEVSYSKVRAMTRVATPTNEARLLHMAQEASAAQLETLCRGIEQVTDQGATAQTRQVTLRPCKGGTVRLEARLHPDLAALVMMAIDAAVEEADDASVETPTSRPDGLLRIADAFIADQRPEGRPGGERHQIIVCVSASELHPGDASAESSAGPVGPESKRRLACDASASIVTVDDAGSPLDAGKKTRTVAPALRRALVACDRGCRFPGCNNQHWVDAHHIEHWADRGRDLPGSFARRWAGADVTSLASWDLARDWSRPGR